MGNAPETEPTPNRSAIIRDAIGIGVATGAYALSFGAISVASGLSVLQTCVLSLLLFSGGSQFALVGVLGAGGSAVAAAGTAVLLGSRNALYGLRLAPLLKVRGLKRAGAAQLVIDESTAMAVGRDSERAARLGFWSTGLSVFILWNLGTLLGGFGAQALRNPEVLGLDAAAPAAFLALLASRMRTRQPWVIAVVAALVALVSVPFVPAGVPVLLAAAAATVLVLRARSGDDTASVRPDSVNAEAGK
ncbi:AzlC family ABC transporter permease [Planosporangium thailandense]|uniref:AzlC family ABC transporter permease n=1 Tax=Planosporangium thailandense TaxID=765197 RepID=A0ABX0Y0Q0_9ACTN|nr:AzlC family ABC transporter permease [Planosporangium thailandense]NJC71613.1 AzlC family ABC transporter permease [Planosporangium thailandense]